ncbi:MAG: YpmA family protein [Carboxydocellales bacterium]
MEQERDRLELIATKTLTANEDMYKIIDFLNKTLKEKRVMFGLTLNRTENTMTISVYEV